MMTYANVANNAQTLQLAASYRPLGSKNMLNSAEHDIFPSH